MVVVQYPLVSWLNCDTSKRLEETLEESVRRNKVEKNFIVEPTVRDIQ